MIDINTLGEHIGLEGRAISLLLEVPSDKNELGRQVAQELCSNESCSSFIHSDPVHPYYINYFLQKVSASQRKDNKTLIVLEGVHKQANLTSIMMSLEKSAGEELIIVATTDQVNKLGLEKGLFSHRFRTEDGKQFERVL